MLTDETGRADNADIPAWLNRRLDAAWVAYQEEEEKHWSVLCCASFEQKIEAQKKCLSAALTAWENYAP
jgi:hypothetical protein